MQKLIIIIALMFINSVWIFTQQDINTILDKTLSYRGLTRQDITIPIDFYASGEKSPTNDSKLLLPLVRDMMISPLPSIKPGSPMPITMDLMDDLLKLKDLDLYEPYTNNDA
jgi:hypothetical protein